MEANKKKRRLPKILIALILLLILGIFVIIFGADSNEEDKNDTGDMTQETQTTAEDNTETKEDKKKEDETESSEDTKEEKSNERISGEDVKDIVQEENESYQSGEIKVSNFSRFSGQFVEDGKDELVKNVAVILVTNKTDQFLEFATLEYEIDGKEAVFIVTGLPAGKSAWVLENSRLEISTNATFSYKGCVDSFRDDIVTSTDKFLISADGNMLTVVNNTTQTLDNVCVYYKVLHSDGNYLGGITYVVNFGKLKTGESLEKIAGHYAEENAEIVRISWQDS